MRTLVRLAILAGLVALVTKLVTDLRNGPTTATSTPTGPLREAQTPDWMRRPPEATPTATPAAPAAPAAAKAAKAAAEAPAGPDRLTAIKGLGPRSEEQLRAARVRTFADLAAMTPEQVSDIIASPPPGADFKSWIAEAKRLADDGSA
jgi:predicted flap endonuclease-1-like 5' DNA nuclease